jgi:hypothetical protein
MQAAEQFSSRVTPLLIIWEEKSEKADVPLHIFIWSRARKYLDTENNSAAMKRIKQCTVIAIDGCAGTESICKRLGFIFAPDGKI